MSRVSAKTDTIKISNMLSFFSRASLPSFDINSGSDCTIKIMLTEAFKMIVLFNKGRATRIPGSFFRFAGATYAPNVKTDTAKLTNSFPGIVHCSVRLGPWDTDGGLRRDDLMMKIDGAEAESPAPRLNRTQ